jgi:hypothetical protein
MLLINYIGRILLQKPTVPNPVKKQAISVNPNYY